MCRYWAWREPLLAGMSLLLSPFLASIARPSARDVAAALQPLAGVGLWAFAVHTCGLGFLMAAPLLLRVRAVWGGVYMSEERGRDGVGQWV